MNTMYDYLRLASRVRPWLIPSEEIKVKKTRGIKGKPKQYVFFYKGDIVVIRNLQAYCDENGLKRASLCRVANGYDDSHKGYTRYE